MSKSTVTVELEPPVPPEYRVQLGNELVRFYTRSPAGHKVYECVDGRWYRLTAEELEPGVFRAELVE